MGLGVKQGDLIEMTAEGDDEDAAIADLKYYIWSHF